MKGTECWRPMGHRHLIRVEKQEVAKPVGIQGHSSQRTSRNQVSETPEEVYHWQ